MRRFLLQIGLASTLLIPNVVAALNLKIYCGGLPGCPGNSASNFPDYMTSAVNVILIYLPQYIIALSATFVLIGGMYMILNMGSEQNFETGKKTVIAALGGLALAMFADNLVGFVGGENYLDPASIIFGKNDTILGILFAAQRIILTFFNLALIAAVLYNGMRLVVSRGNDEQYTKALSSLLYSALGAVIINLAQRLVNAVLGFPI